MRLLIDVSGLVYRAAYKHGHLTDAKGVKTGIVYGVLRSLEKIAREAQAEELVVCWDGGPQKRKAIYPDYKSNRKRDPEFEEDKRRQQSILVRLFAKLPVVQVWEPEVEADDAIAVLCKFLHLERVGIVTGDKDLYQLASPPKHTIVSLRGEHVRLDLKPSQYLTYSVLVGKGSNTLPGIPRVGDKTARALIAQHGSLKRIVEAAHISGDKIGSLIYSDAKKIIRRNLQLMRLGILLDEGEKRSILDQYKRGRLNRRIDEKGLRQDLLALGFASYLQRFSAFLIPFRGMERTGYAEAERRLPFGLHEEDQKAGGSRSKARAESGKEFTKRIRKLGEGSRGGRGQDSEARRAGGRGASGASEGVGRKRAVSSTGREGPSANRLAFGKADTYHKRIRKAEPSDAVGVGVGGGDQRVVRTDKRGASRDRVETRGGRAKRPLEKLFASEQVKAKRHNRRQEAIFILSTFKDEEGWSWLKSQDASVLRFVSALCQAIEKDQRFAPKASHLRELTRMREAYLEEEPDWMR